MTFLTETEKGKGCVLSGRVSTEHYEARYLHWVIKFNGMMNKRKITELESIIDKYIDEGITGTQAKKRPAFLKMIDDAKKNGLI